MQISIILRWICRTEIRLSDLGFLFRNFCNVFWRFKKAYPHILNITVNTYLFSVNLHLMKMIKSRIRFTNTRLNRETGNLYPRKERWESLKIEKDINVYFWGALIKINWKLQSNKNFESRKKKGKKMELW